MNGIIFRVPIYVYREFHGNDPISGDPIFRETCKVPTAHGETPGKDPCPMVMADFSYGEFP